MNSGLGHNQSEFRLPVAVDVMGGDLGSAIIVEGALQAALVHNIPVILVGNESQIVNALNQQSAANNPLVSICHAADVITMEDTPAKAIRTKPQASIVVAFELLKAGKASAVVSAGNTGGMMAAGMFISGILPGIVRPAIASFLPRMSASEPTILLDSGANIDCSAEQLVQFATMGSLYAKHAGGISEPKVALLSNGTESSKGTEVIRAAAQILRTSKNINYVGFVEGRDIPKGSADVVVCDGFIGNIVLKTMEGTAELVFKSIKNYAEGNFLAKLSLGFAKPMLKKLFHDKLDPSAYGGAPLLGLKDIGIVCHGRSNQRAIKNAVRVAQRLSDAKINDLVRVALAPTENLDANCGAEGQGSSEAAQRFERKKNLKNLAAQAIELSATNLKNEE